jgi:hypothetical protein
VLGVIAAFGVAALVAGFTYLKREGLGVEGAGLAALRTVALGSLLVLFLNPARNARVSGGPPTVLLDASLSMHAAGGQWSAALDTARATAGVSGTLLRFGTSVTSFDTVPPGDGRSRLVPALAAAQGRGRPVVVVTDGELDDAATLPPGLLGSTTVILLPRDTAPGAALLEVRLSDVVQRDDSVALELTIGTWGLETEQAAQLEVFVGERRLLARELALAPGPGTAHRRVVLPPRTLEVGEHTLRVLVTLAGDAEPRDDERWRIVRITDRPAVVVIVDPADWEGRFLVRTLQAVSGTSVRGFARTGDTSWIDMRSGEAAPLPVVRGAARRAGLLVLRGGNRGAVAPRRGGPVWRWPGGSDPSTELFAGDWYVSSNVPASPLAGRLAGVVWDSLPPLAGVVPLAPSRGEWVALTARRGRRGAERPVLVGTDTAGQRELTTAGAGVWRWAFRGGAAAEAYRALVAAGVDWLLASEVPARQVSLTTADVTMRGTPVVFRWRGDSPPDSLAVTLEAGEETQTVTLRFDADGVALVLLEPGVYAWSTPAAPGAGGIAVVEPYSDEFAPRPVTRLTAGAAGFMWVETYARERWWLFLMALVAFAAEWAWRQRRGLS